MTPALAGNDLRSFMRRASGNELKILIAIWYLERDGKNTNVEAISHEAMINRATVYRLLPRMAKNQWVEYRLTADGRMMAEYALTDLVRPPVADITDTPGPSPQCLPSNATSSTGVANRDSAPRVNPSQNATESHSATPSTLSHRPQQLTGTKDSTGFASPFVRRGKDLAKQTARALNDGHSLGMHTQLWYRALSVDEANGNHTCENTILSYTRELQERLNRTGRPQGAAFTARVKAMLVQAELMQRNK